MTCPLFIKNVYPCTKSNMKGVLNVTFVVGTYVMIFFKLRRTDLKITPRLGFKLKTPYLLVPSCYTGALLLNYQETLWLTLIKGIFIFLSVINLSSKHRVLGSNLKIDEVVFNGNICAYIVLESTYHLTYWV